MSTNTEILMPDGTAHITRIVPVPNTLSPEAQIHLATGKTWAPEAVSPEQQEQIDLALSMYPVQIKDATMAGVPVKIVTPQQPREDKRNCVLLNFHGGGFVSDSGSMLESIPIAALTGITVVTALYRLAPAHPFPAAVDDAEAVYRELLKTYSPKHMVMYGTSAGAMLSAQTLIRLRQNSVPLPAALGFFTGPSDFSRGGDTRTFFSVPGLAGAPMAQPGKKNDSPYVGAHDRSDPALSPIYADLSGFPPTLCIAGTRDMLLSDTANFHRALLRAGVDADLVVFDAMPHAHWYMVGIPEAQEANELMALLPACLVLIALRLCVENLSVIQSPPHATTHASRDGVLPLQQFAGDPAWHLHTAGRRERGAMGVAESEPQHRRCRRAGE